MSKFTLQDAIDLATFAHRNQYDKAGEPYITHPLRVLESVKFQGAEACVQMAAVLHDVTEDTPFTPQMLIALGVPESAIEIVSLLDRNESAKAYYEAKRVLSLVQKGQLPPGNTYDSDIDAAKLDKDSFYYAGIKNSEGAVQVKLADIRDNLQPWRLNHLPPETRERLRNKYDKALSLLGQS